MWMKGRAECGAYGMRALSVYAQQGLTQMYRRFSIDIP